MRIQMKNVVADSMCLALTAMLYFGVGAVHDFAFYVQIALTTIAGLAVCFGSVKGETAQRIRSRVWWSGLLSGLRVAALIMTGHAMLAAASFVFSCLIVTAAFSKGGVESEA